MKFTSLILSGMALVLGAASPVSAQLRLSGAAPMAALLEKKQADIESAAGVKLQIVAKNTALGLQDVTTGKADLALAGGPLDKIVEAANAQTPGSLDLASLRVFEVAQEAVVFVVHPSNPIKSLTLVQLGQLFSGKIANWKEVGGPDLPVKICAMSEASGARMSVDKNVLGGASLVASAAVRASPKDISPIVAQVPGALGFLTKPSLGPGVEVLKTDQPVVIAMQLVSKGEPTAAQQSFIAVVRAVLASP